MRIFIDVMVPRELETTIGVENINSTLERLRLDAACMVQSQLFHMAERSAIAHKALMEVNEMNRQLRKSLEVANTSNTKMFQALQKCQYGFRHSTEKN